MSKEVLVGPGVTDIAPGWKAEVTIKRRYPGIVSGRTAIHEARHIVIDPDNVKRGTIYSGPGYLGLTELYVFDPYAAAAPHGAGDNGTGHDMRLVAMHGHDVGAVTSAAGSMVNSLEKEVEDVAILLQAKGEITGHEAKQAMQEGRNPEAKVVITNPLGETRDFVAKVRVTDGFVIPVDLTELPEDRIN